MRSGKQFMLVDSFQFQSHDQQYYAPVPGERSACSLLAERLHSCFTGLVMVQVLNPLRTVSSNVWCPENRPCDIMLNYTDQLTSSTSPPYTFKILSLPRQGRLWQTGQSYAQRMTAPALVTDPNGRMIHYQGRVNAFGPKFDSFNYTVYRGLGANGDWRSAVATAVRASSA